MSKNIIIQEGGITKQMTVSKIKVNDVGGGTSLWVPEDSTTLVTKSISKNGTYEASSDNAYGYSEVTVNVAGGKGSATSSGTPTTSNGVDPGGIGSAIVGTNPTTGNEEAVGVDSGGNLVATPLPSSIVLVTNPSKMSYLDGETIDITGAVVAAKNADGSTWTNSDYPNGHIPLGELVVSPTTASDHESTIMLAWTRPGDDKVLSATYEIAISSGGIVARSDSYVSGEGTIISENNGTRTPVTKVSATRSAVLLGINTNNDPPSGDWISVYSVGLTAEDALINMPGIGSGPTSYQYQGHTLYLSAAGTNQEFGGATTFTNPLGLPVVYDVPLNNTAQWPSQHQFENICHILRISFVNPGSGYSDDSGGSESGGGGYFGDNDDNGGSQSGGGGNF